MKAKRMMAALLAGTMAASVASFMTASAAGEKVSISASKETAAPGEAFSIDVSLADIPASGLCTVDFALAFDTSLVTISDVSTGALCDTGAAAAEGKIDASIANTTFEWNVIDDQICLLWVTGLKDSAYWLKQGGVFVTIKGTVKDTAKDGSVCNFDIVPVAREAFPETGVANSDILMGAVDSDGVVTKYATTLANGALTIASAGDVMYGDITEDGKVTIADLVMIARYAAEDAEMTMPSEQGLRNADCNGDGKINSSDCTMVARYLAHLITAEDMGPQA